MNTTITLLDPSDNFLQSFLKFENDSSLAVTSGDAEFNLEVTDLNEVNDLRHDVGGPFSELVVFPQVVVEVEVNDPNLQVDVTPTDPPPPIKRKRGRPPNPTPKITRVTKRTKKYEEPPTTKAVRNAIGAKRNRDLKKELFAKMESEIESLKAQKLALENQVVTLLVEKKESAAKNSLLTEQNSDYRKRLDVILKNASVGGEKVEHVDGTWSIADGESTTYSSSSDETFQVDHVDDTCSSADITSSQGTTYLSLPDDTFEGCDSFPELNQLIN
ncbi:uncharacterized protein LOC110854687 [Folsomia candida]|uniref:Proto-oncogene c-Fos n=1 Tax=Folsomia candida TaxID=158441 RepID=A0A226DY00_FOLCA|nr:uncharacterized protein LOC110854687 [Folsomia candida]OXA49684.1 Proto-oncogene c-Fos [Folsomia candida]